MNILARTLSILGHPLLLLPGAVLTTLPHGVSLAYAATGFALFGVAVMGWSWWQVRRGRWTHVDASGRDERRVFNRAMLAVLALSCMVAWLYGLRPLAVGLGCAAAIIAAALLTSRWCKLSLHGAFAVYAALLLWRSGTGPMLAGLAFAAVLAWSRLALARHVPRDLVAGAIAGAAAGGAFWAWPGLSMDA